MRRVVLIGIAVVALGTSGGAAQAATRHKPVRRAPTELWNAFPLREQAPRVSYSVGDRSASQRNPFALGADTGAGSTGRFASTMVLLALTLIVTVYAVAFAGIGPTRTTSRGGRARSKRGVQPPEQLMAQAAEAAWGWNAVEAPRPEPTRRGRRKKIARAGARDVDVLKAKSAAARRPTDVEILKTKLAKREPIPGDAAPDDRCRVQWNHRYVRSAFAATVATSAEQTTVAVSPSFRWWRNAPPTTGSTQAVEALAALVDELQQHGWAVTGQSGRQWFELELERVPSG
jgi:hypothetical protein